MKNQVLRQPFWQVLPAVLPGQPTHPGLIFNTSIWTIFPKIVKKTTTVKSIKNQSFIVL